MKSPSIDEFEAVSRALGEGSRRLSLAQFQGFWRDGHLGPLSAWDTRLRELPRIVAEEGLLNRATGEPCPHPAEWASCQAEHINVVNPHRSSRAVLEVCSDPCVVNVVAQLLGTREVCLYHSRFRVKFAQHEDPVPWHQDVGASSGGCFRDGKPIPTITVWASVDGASADGGAVVVVPATHTRLLGDWQKGFHSDLEGSGALEGIDLSDSVALEAEPGQFHLLHSWTLHTSTANDTRSARSGLVLRFAARGDAVDPSFDYVTLTAR